MYTYVHTKLKTKFNNAITKEAARLGVDRYVVINQLMEGIMAKKKAAKKAAKKVMKKC